MHQFVSDLSFGTGYASPRSFDWVRITGGAMSNNDLGQVYEQLITGFIDVEGLRGGEFFTPRSIVRLMVNILDPQPRETIFDPACGTGGMLTEAKEHLLNTVNEKLDVFLFGQEINEQTYAIAKSDILMKGEAADNIKHGNTITKDRLVGKQFNYMLTNPPFGDDWKNMREYVEEEAELGTSGRFQAGLPDVSDGSLLFLQHKINK